MTLLNNSKMMSNASLSTTYVLNHLELSKCLKLKALCFAQSFSVKFSFLSLF